MKGLMNKFLKWKEAFESKGLKVNLGKTKVNFQTLKVKPNSILCAQCGRWTHGRYARMKRMIQKYSRNITCRKC